MKLIRLDIRLLPGIDQPFSVDFQGDRVNLVTGPNASGKSSLIRAVRALLYPDQTNAFCHLHAEWQRDGQRLECERRGSAVTWLDDSGPTTAPRLPDADSSGAFLVSAEDLTAPGRTDQHISAELRTMLAGGYDLDAVLDAPPLAARPRPQKLARELSRAGSELAAKEREYAELDEELARLETLEGQLAETTDASARLRACEDALALADAIARRSAVEHALIEEFPGGMDRLRGDEIKRLEQLEQQSSQRERELAGEHSSLNAERRLLEQSGTRDPQALETLQAELADRRDQLNDLERRIETLDDQVEQAEQAAARAARRLGSEQPEPSPELDQASLESLEKQVDRVQGLREQIRNLTGELVQTHVSKNVTGRAQDDLRRARRALKQWLENAGTSPLEGVLWGGLGAAALLAAWRLLRVESLSPSPELILLVLIAAGVPLTLLGHFFSRWRELKQAHNDFADTDIEPPLGWTFSEVEARIERLDLELESATRHELAQARAEDLRAQLNSQRTGLEQARAKLREFAAEHAISADPRLETGFQLWCRHLHDWQQQHEAWAQACQQREQLRARYQEYRQACFETLREHQLEGQLEGGEPPTGRDLARLVHQLSPRIREAGERRTAIQAHNRRIEELQNDLRALKKNRDELYQQAGVKPGDRETLTRRLDLFPTWQDMEQQRRDGSVEVRRLEARLSEEAELLEQAREQQREVLEKNAEALSARVAERDQINRRIAEIQTRHEELLKRRELESLAAGHERAREALDRELDHQLIAEAAAGLLDDVRATHQADNEPRALARAGAWLERFTRHRYQLVFDNQAFLARDTRSNRRLAIGEMSSASRVQLLLAVRLAWIEQAESGTESLPVFLDEVLTTTDPDRYRAIVESVQEIVADGRQMFYLTAHNDDAQAWRDWNDSGQAAHVIDMAEVRGDQVEPLKYQLPASRPSRRELPDPAGMSALEWAEKAGIGAIDPALDGGAINVFHLLHDRLKLARRLLKLDLATLGELESFLASELAGRLFDAGVRELLGKRVAAARLILRDWQARHSLPVDEAALAASGAVSENFMPRVVALNESVGGRPEKLIKGLRNSEVSRFRADNTDQLEQWLTDQGYLVADPAPDALTTADISLRAGLTADETHDLRDWIIGAIRDPFAATESGD